MSQEALRLMSERIAEAIGGRRNAMRFARGYSGAGYKKLQSWIDGKTWPDLTELLALSEASGKPLAFFLPHDALEHPTNTSKEPPLGELVSITLPRIALVEAYAALRVSRSGLRLRRMIVSDARGRDALDCAISQSTEAAQHLAQALGFEFEPEAHV